jgi:hypothetical protein
MLGGVFCWHVCASGNHHVGGVFHKGTVKGTVPPYGFPLCTVSHRAKREPPPPHEDERPFAEKSGFFRSTGKHRCSYVETTS